MRRDLLVLMLVGALVVGPVASGVSATGGVTSRGSTVTGGIDTAGDATYGNTTAENTTNESTTNQSTADTTNESTTNQSTANQSTTTATNITTSDSNTSVGTTLLSEPLNQSATISPGPNQTFVDGGVYSAIVSVNVGEEGWFNLEEVSEPKLELNLSGNGASIISITSAESDYDVIPANVAENCTKGCTIESTNPFKAPNKTHAAKHSVLIRFALNQSRATETVTLEADPTPDKQNGDDAQVTYDVIQSADSKAQLAQASAAQARLVETYNQSYNDLLNIDWDSRVDRRIQREFTIVVNDAAQSLVTAYADEVLAGFSSLRYANNLDTLRNAQTAYGMSQGSFGGATTVGKISRVNRRLYADFQKAMDVEPIKDAGNTSYVLDELNRLSKAEAEAWRNGNRTKVKRILYKKEYLLLGYTGHVSASYRHSFNESFDPPSTAPETPSLVAQARNQRQEAAHREAPVREDYFDAVVEYARSEFDRVRDVSLPMARDPAPGVTLDSSRSGLRSRLANLSVGETTTVTLRVSNGENAGVTSTQGYLSVSHSNALSITEIEQRSGDSDVLVENTSVGESVFYRNGTQAPADYPLTDIYEPYDPNETNTYRLTLERTAENGTAWLTYRTAFEPLIHNDSAPASFVRYPTTETTASTDQQNWPAFNVSTTFDSGANETNSAPTARIGLSNATTEPGISITFDASNSTDPDGTIATYEWTFDDGTTATGATVSHAYDTPGTYDVSLTVTDDGGASATATRTVTVEAPATPYFAVDSLTTNGSVDAGTPLNVSARVSNTGNASGTATVSASGPGDHSGSRTLQLAAGESARVSVSLSTTNVEPGDYTVTATTPNETASTPVTIDHATPPTYNVSIIGVRGGPEGAGENATFGGEPLRIAVEVTNTDDYAGNRTVTLSATRAWVYTPVQNQTDVQLDPGESVERVLSVPTDEMYPGYETRYEATVSVEGSEESASISGALVPKTKRFLLQLNDTNRPVEPGEPFEATVHVRNDGYVTDTQTISLNLSGIGTADTTVELVGQAAETVTLSVPTDTGTTGRYEARIASENDSASVPVNVFPTPEADIDTEDLPGNGTAANPYVLTNASELQAMEDDPEAHYVLGSDIDASGTAEWNGGRGFDPVGESEANDPANVPFRGLFDGRGHTIHNLTINRSNEGYVGLFGTIGWGAGGVENVTLADANVTGDETVGGLVGFSNAPINNSAVSGRVAGTSGVGGVVGTLGYAGLVRQSSARGTVTGIPGEFGTSGDLGGLVGDVMESGDFTGSIEQSYALVNVSGGYDVGGLVGYNRGTINDSYAAGYVSGTRSGGLVGSGDGTANDAYWDSNATGQSTSAGGTELTTGQMTGIAARSNMTGLAFDGTWTARVGDYPVLAWQADARNVTPTPDIAYRDIAVNRTEIAPGEEITVNATVANDGTAAGSFNASLVVNDTAVERANGTLDPGETRTVQFTNTFAETGTYGLYVGNGSARTASVSVTVQRPHAELGFEPANATIGPDGALTVNVTVDTGETSLYGATTVVAYDSDALNATAVSPGGFLESDGADTFVPDGGTIDERNGTVSLSVARRNASEGVSGTGTLATLTFEMAANATDGETAALSIADETTLSTASQTAVPYETSEGTVSVDAFRPNVSVTASLADTVWNVGATATVTANASANVPLERIGYRSGPNGNARAVADRAFEKAVAFELTPAESTWNGDGYGMRNVTVEASAQGTSASDTRRVPVHIAGDATGDGRVNLFDAVAVGTAWDANATTTPNAYAGGADLNSDGEIGVSDAALLGREWGDTAG